MEILSGVHGNFKIAKPSRFSNVQRILKPWLTMVTINFRVYPTVFPTEKNKILFAISYLDAAAFNWVQPRLEDFLENDDKKQKQKTQQMFYKFDNFCIYIKEVSGNQDEDKAMEKHGPNPSQKINHGLKEILWSLTLPKKKGFKKKICYVCGKLGHLKRNCPKKNSGNVGRVD